MCDVLDRNISIILIVSYPFTESGIFQCILALLCARLVDYMCSYWRCAYDNLEQRHYPRVEMMTMVLLCGVVAVDGGQSLIASSAGGKRERNEDNDCTWWCASWWLLQLSCCSVTDSSALCGHNKRLSYLLRLWVVTEHRLYQGFFLSP